MLSRGLHFGLRFSSRRVVTQITSRNAASEPAYDKDPAPYFFNEEIQTILKTVTRPSTEKVFRRQLNSENLVEPEYKFMTDQELEDARRQANQLMWERLQMPPVVKVREEDGRVLSKDPALQGFSDAKFVVTDITFGISNKDRIIAVRELDGTLRKAFNHEKDRLNQVYFPIPGREVFMPKMFQEEYLQAVLDRKDYEFILNRACIQFEPDSEDFHRVTRVTYDCIYDKMHFDHLRSTRHFGPMVFYLAWNKKIDNLLIENIQTERIEDAALVIKLYYKLNPSEKAIKEEDNVKLIQHFIDTEAGSKGKLIRALQTHLEIEAERRKIRENVEKHIAETKSSDEEIKT
ncbi:28S ribosomal protein S22, mitochondrial [Nasonia vitripennis]|uniref:28S ribosomal protein S22, mitochondrial n=1 Tax=Nasonia vitripennis TaxID=7425 RepID=A0A7M7R175_NASVI|nr:28S ribosomal protein S22, mitochondrial [Nasonia vitripennis]XP_032456720.1 28S ribosomal protein S22, mitochondrial [Nasonia vitripennis]